RSRLAAGRPFVAAEPTTGRAAGAAVWTAGACGRRMVWMGQLWHRPVPLNVGAGQGRASARWSREGRARSDSATTFGGGAHAQPCLAGVGREVMTPVVFIVHDDEGEGLLWEPLVLSGARWGGRPIFARARTS